MMMHNLVDKLSPVQSTKGKQKRSIGHKYPNRKGKYKGHKNNFGHKAPYSSLKFPFSCIYYQFLNEEKNIYPSPKWYQRIHFNKTALAFIVIGKECGASKYSSG